MSATVQVRDAIPGKACGPCTLCCKLLPVAEISKPKNRWCEHARSRRGCAIYADRPESCRVWNCQWLGDVEMPPELRPDLSHCVFDPLPDVIRAWPEGDGKPSVDVTCVQLWLDPNYPDAWRRKSVLDQIERFGRHGCPTIVRTPTRTTVVLAPGVILPGMPGDTGTWRWITPNEAPESKFAEARKALGWKPWEGGDDASA